MKFPFVSRRRASVVTASGIVFLGTAAVTVLGAINAQAATTPLTGSQAAQVANGTATVQNNEWGSSEPESLTINGTAGFTVANSSISNATNGAPGGYPSIYSGCHWGSCTQGGLAAHPVQVSALARPGTVTTTWKTTQPGGKSAYDVAYDIWFNQQPTASGQPNGAELMVWLNHHGGVQPYGSRVGTATIKGVSYVVWEGAQSWGDTISYVMDNPTTSVTNLDVGALASDAVNRGYVRNSWYLIDIEAGFELWRGGAGLATNDFAVNVRSGQAAPAPTQPRTPVHTPVRTPVRKPVHTPASTPKNPAPASPAPTSPAPTTPAPSQASPLDISLQAISPQPATPGATTNATVDFKDSGSAAASNVTVVVEVLNSAGAVVGSQSWIGQNVAPQEVLNETYTWTAASQPGRYTVEGLTKDSSGKTLQQARVATVTVN